MKHDYDLLVIGGGAAGLTASGIGASLGAKTAMIEAQKLGGDCTWYGCVPSKALIKSAKVAHLMRSADHYGLSPVQPEFDFAGVTDRIDHIREEIYKDADHPDIFRAMGIDVLSGRATFVDPHTVEIEGEDGGRFSARKIIIASGSHPFVPPIEGLEDVGYHTNETIFEIKVQPKRLGIIGGGPIGTELAQAFQRLGTQVTVFERGGRFLKKDDAELADLLKEVLEKEGVQFRFEAGVERVAKADGGIRIHYTQNDKSHTQTVDAVLVSTGRRPNIDRLNLEAAGVAYTKKGITINKKCRTSKSHIYAIGDASMAYQFTHMSEHSAKVAATNALLKLPSKLDLAHVPWVTYTDPELAHVGATRAELEEKGTSFEVYRFPYTKVDRGITDGNTVGWIKVYGTKWRGKILGVDILGSHAGEQICEYALAMRNGVSLRDMADTIHPYPTYGLGSRRAADQWYIKNQSLWLVKLIQTVFRYRGPLPDLSDPDRIV